LKQAVAAVKTETLTAIGKAVLEVNQKEASTEVLQKIEDIKDADVNGKQFVDMKLTKTGITIKSNGKSVSVKDQRPAAPQLPSDCALETNGTNAPEAQSACASLQSKQTGTSTPTTPLTPQKSN
jgi:hypothetical protein